MTLTEKWTSNLKNGIFRGLVPTIDPFDPTSFYLGDGWYSAFPSMKLRKLSLESGKEIGTASIKNSIRCLYFNSNKIDLFASSDNKIFHIDRTSFVIKNKFEKGIQKYNDFISSNDKDTLLLMNYNSDFLFVYNYKLNKSVKKKLKSCRGIFKETETNFLIFSAYNGTVIRYNLTNNTLKDVLKTEIFYSATQTSLGTIFFQSGYLKEATTNTAESIEHLSKLKIYKSISDKEPQIIDFDFEFTSFIVSELEDTIYLFDENSIYIYSLKDKTVIDNYSFEEKTRIAQIFVREKRILTYKYDEEKALKCWAY